MQQKIELISKRLNISESRVAGALQLLLDGATIPFIARYRKEKTGGLNEVQIATIADEYHRFLEIDDRKVTILKTIEELGKLNKELQDAYFTKQTLNAQVMTQTRQSSIAKRLEEKGSNIKESHVAAIKIE